MLRSSGPSSAPACRRMPPGEYVEQESFMRAGRDSGAGAPGRHCARGLGAGSVLRSRRARTVHHAGAGLLLSGGRLQLQRDRHRTGARSRPSLSLRGRADPADPAGPFDVVLLLETMLAFADKEPLLREISQALTTGGRFAFTLEAGLPLTDAERELMPDADTVWLAPAGGDAHMLGAGRAGRPLAGRLQPIPRGDRRSR